MVMSWVPVVLGWSKDQAEHWRDQGMDLGLQGQLLGRLGG